MFIGNVSGKETINNKAAAIGLKAGEALRGLGGYGKPGVTGNTYPVKEQLKAAGAKFDGENKAWVFDSWEQLDQALDSLAA
ncbi:hypothetical protein [Parvibium lacunae]|uniref:Uncharacterized protein n=1 Tax=Parvibium lacunae TaxID=1888893 RepID=A0A368L7R2_9BURK|nr:hypothetical protein [Parvibium lacunae]RCS59705.1 hypothetical protein DU000_03080 [Parvibium lacunae]